MYFGKRLFDLFLAIIAAIFLLIPFLLVAIAVAITSKGPVLYWSDRVGKNNQIFRMPKFRTMLIDTPQVATHELQNPKSYLTPIGHFLRASSLDEIPQLWSVLIGDMSVVGPRPALFNQDDLVELRTTVGVHKCRPGITGWAQINGRDEIPIPDKVKLDEAYCQKPSLFNDVKIIFMTAYRVIAKTGVSH